METDSIPADHKLCGFLRTVLALPSAHAPNSLPPNTICQIISDGPDVVFRTSNGVVLTTINTNAGTEAATAATTPSFRNNKRLSSRIGLVNGSRSVVHQIHALVIHKCLKVIARVVSVVGDFRVVVLVDVYLPIALWSGWQFPRSKSIAAALFRHLSCDWEARSSMLEFGKADNVQNDNAWDIFDCHVLGCNQHCCVPDASKKRLFELQEIFKSLPSVLKKGDYDSSRVNPADVSCTSGLWVLSDDVLTKVLTALGPLDLLRISSTCRHLRFLAASVMPCMKLKLFPHQQAAVEWMLQRERDSEVMLNPLYRHFITEDGFAFYMNTVSGEVVTAVPTIKDFRGGMFCDEPGLGKTITALSLILKTQGTWADPPDGLEVIWCKHNSGQKCGYYEVSGDTVNHGCWSSGKKMVGRAGQRGLLSLDQFDSGNYRKPASFKTANAPTVANSTPATCVVRGTRTWTRVKRNLLYEYEEASCHSREKRVRDSSKRRNHSSVYLGQSSLQEQDDLVYISSPCSSKRSKKASANYVVCNETWVQCDACRKWRRLVDTTITDTSTAWFCSMNSDQLHQNCSASEESWDFGQSITYLPEFYTKGTSDGQEENVSFFTSVLKDHYSLMNAETEKALTWLAKLSPDKLLEMETTGLLPPPTATRVRFTGNAHDFHKIFQAFGFIKRVEQGKTRSYYPKNLVNLAFDLSALRSALCEPLDSLRLYLSRATLVVVPSNLVDHWNTQIQKHVRHGQLRVYVWTDHKKPSAHILAWDYDVVITSFSRLSAEWRPRKRSVLLQVHWLRVIFDEVHTLGSSVSLSNRLQISLSLTATSRWLLTGTPTPNTPSSQLSHLHPMLKFLREEAYGQNQTSWDGRGAFTPVTVTSKVHDKCKKI